MVNLFLNSTANFCRSVTTVTLVKKTAAEELSYCQLFFASQPAIKY